MGIPAPGLFGYSHMMGGYAGGQAQYVRVPFANVGPLKIESDLPDEKVLFLSDIFPTGYMAAENAQITEGDTVAVWGCGPVGQFAIASAFMLGAARVIAIDRFEESLEMARSIGAITVNYSEEDICVLTALKDLTGGAGPDSCIDAVGLEAHSSDLQGVYDKVKTALCWRRIGREFCGKPLWRFAKAGQSRFREFTVACWTKYPSARHLAKASP